MSLVLRGSVFGDVTLGGEQKDARVVERERLGGIVRHDDADGHEAVAQIVDTGVGSGVLGIAGVGGDGDLLMGVVGGILRGGKRRRDLARLVGVDGQGQLGKC